MDSLHSMVPNDANYIRHTLSNKGVLLDVFEYVVISNTIKENVV